MQIIILTFLCCLTFSSSVMARECNEENCFYAISSIRYHLENLTENSIRDDIEDSVKFTNDEIAHLWNQAEKSDLSDEVALAKSYYYLAIDQNDIGEFNRHIYKSQEILEDVWVELNDEYFEEERVGKLDWLTDSFDPFLKKDVSNDIFREIKPFQLPTTHPAKPRLDEIFEESHHILRDMDSFTNAGFVTLFKQPLSHVIVAKHPRLDGYLVKAYLDSRATGKGSDPGWKWLVRRCMGAENIRKLIRRKNLQHFSVPDKWIYMTDPKAYNPAKQNIILLVTDMKLVSKEESRDAWMNIAGKEHLNELYCIFSHGYSSSWLVANIPYTKSGKFSCIDTEYPKRTMDYEKARRYFNEDMQAYWDLLIRTGGKPELEKQPAPVNSNPEPAPESDQG